MYINVEKARANIENLQSDLETVKTGNHRASDELFKR